MLPRNSGPLSYLQQHFEHSLLTKHDLHRLKAPTPLIWVYLVFGEYRGEAAGSIIPQQLYSWPLNSINCVCAEYGRFSMFVIRLKRITSPRMSGINFQYTSLVGFKSLLYNNTKKHETEYKHPLNDRRRVPFRKVGQVLNPT